MLYNILGNVEGTIENFHVSAMELTILSRLMLSTTVDDQLSDNLNSGNSEEGLIRFDPARQPRAFFPSYPPQLTGSLRLRTIRQLYPACRCPDA